MSLMRVIFSIFLSLVVILSGRIRGEAQKSSKEELEQRLELLNKPPIKSIQSEEGHIFDCIDIYKQPAFDHPLLKDHKIQLQPSALPQGLIETDENIVTTLELEQIECPTRTVPIRRTRKEDLVAAKSLFRLYSAHARQPNSSEVEGYHGAAVKAVQDPSIEYHGAKAAINIYDHDVAIDQFTEGSLFVQNGHDLQLNSIQFGWSVHPNLYADNATHATVSWTADGYRGTGCFNVLCPGFVQVDPNNPVGTKLRNSRYGTDRQVVTYGLVYKDPKTGNWWLVIDAVGGHINIGYWPNSIFTGLQSFATELVFGGRVYSPPSKPLPPMGSGHFIPGDYHRTCYICRIQIVDAHNKLVEPEKTPIHTVGDLPNCYQVSYEGYTGKLLRYAMIFGGPNSQPC